MNKKTTKLNKCIFYWKKFILNFKKFWNYTWNDDSFFSYVLSLAVAFIIIKFILFPGLGFLLNNDFPIVAIVTGSMEHKIVNNQICGYRVAEYSSKKLDLDEWWSYCGSYYEKNFGLVKKNFSEDFRYKNGLNIGDVMILYGKKVENIQVGEVLVFIPQDKMSNNKSQFFTRYGPVIHRVVKKWYDETDKKYYFQTKGDHNPESIERFERKIPQEDVIAVGVVRIPYIGYIKLALNNVLVKLGVVNVFR